MSRYVHVELAATTLEDVERALKSLRLNYERPRRRVRLRGSLECTGDPVDIRLDAGIFDTVEDFGFVVDNGSVRLVCGELDQGRLETELLPPLRQATASETVVRAAAQQGMRVRATETAADGSKRLIIDLDG